MVSSLLVSLEDSLPVVGQDTRRDKLAAAGDALLQSTEKLAGALVEPTSTQISRRMATNTTGVLSPSHSPHLYCVGHSSQVDKVLEVVSKSCIT